MSDQRGQYTSPGWTGWNSGWTAPAQGPAGPPNGQFLGTFQQIVQAINNQANSLNGLHGLSPTIFPQMQLNPEAAPSPPSTGAIIYVDATTHDVMVVKADGTRVRLA